MENKKFVTVDGNQATALAAYPFTEIAGIYPITPSSPMADYVDKWSKQNKLNIFHQTVNVIEMQSEGGASGVLHGAASGGTLATTFTASQGLLLMLPDMFKIAGEMLPVVMHVAARTIATHALSIFGDHSDVMAARTTGFAQICSASVQEAYDMALVTHLAAIKQSMPFMHFFDGFRTSHEIQKIAILPDDILPGLVDREALRQFRARSLSPNNPWLYGSNQNGDIFFQAREACNSVYAALPQTVETEMRTINALTGKNYQLFNYYGAADAKYVIVAMGSICETIKDTINYLQKNGSNDLGLVQVHLYRPFVHAKLRAAVPASCRCLAVLDRTKEPGANNEPLKLDVMAAFSGEAKAPKIIGGRYGLASKDTTPDDIFALYRNMQSPECKPEFTLAINDDVTHLSLPRSQHIDTTEKGTVSCRFWGMGSDGTVGANKNTIKIIGDQTDLAVQAYFSYDSKKSGGLTISDLRFGRQAINQPYLVNSADFVSCSQQSYVFKYDMLDDLKPGGSFLLNSIWTAADLERFLPAAYKRKIAEKNIKFYLIDAYKLAKEVGLGKRTNTVLQAAFFAVAKVLPLEQAAAYLQEYVASFYKMKGEEIVQMNLRAVKAGLEAAELVDVPDSWANCPLDGVTNNLGSRAWDLYGDSDEAKFMNDVAEMMNRQKGDYLPVSAFMPYKWGNFPQGTTKFEKREVSLQAPRWIAENCIQCNQCSLVCPHAVIRPFLLTEEEAAGKSDLKTVAGTRPYNNYRYRIQVSPLDCTGCAACVETCPAPKKALVMEDLTNMPEAAGQWDYLIKLPRKPNPMKATVVKGSQFNQPYFEFSGACAGCGETPYIKLLTQLFGDKMIISNATGCSSIYGGAVPSQSYCKDSCGRGPAWTNSLFEDNAENGFGLYLAAKQLQQRINNLLNQLFDLVQAENLQVEAEDCNIIKEWQENLAETEGTLERAAALQALLERWQKLLPLPEVQNIIARLLEYKDYFSKRSNWIIGGDGWAYDIGYGGLDHVISTGENVNILVLDTEVYSNTGGQASKATPTAAIAQFAAGGKAIAKKDLGMMAMNYGYVYVAQIAMGANQAQTLKALVEAEKYNGPSLVIAYSPCIEHQIKGGLRYAQQIEKMAVESGYWHLYRYDPTREHNGKNPFQLDSKQPKGGFKEFLMQEGRYSSLLQKYQPAEVDAFIARAEHDAQRRYLSYLRKSKEYETVPADFWQKEAEKSL